MEAIQVQRQKRIVVINDLSGMGRCSLTVALPIISHLGVQCCPVPTAILSNHTGYATYFFDDYTDRMEAYTAEWKKLGFTFDGIATGFLGSARQIHLVRDFLQNFGGVQTQVIVDPVMGDHGKLYVTYTQELCQEMKGLVELADIATPNLTEACSLTGTPYKESGWHKKELREMAEKIVALGPDRVVITGIPQGEFIANYVCEKGSEQRLLRTHRVGTGRPGTGDVFASIIAADAVNGIGFDQSVRRASGFVRKCIKRTIELEIPQNDGVCFEEMLPGLRRNA